MIIWMIAAAMTVGGFQVSDGKGWGPDQAQAWASWAPSCALFEHNARFLFGNQIVDHVDCGTPKNVSPEDFYRRAWR